MYEERSKIEMRFSNKVVGSCTVQILLDHSVGPIYRSALRSHILHWLRSKNLHKKRISDVKLEVSLKKYLLDNTSATPIRVGFYYGKPEVKILGPAYEDSIFVWER
jgi:hypothetical protein